MTDITKLVLRNSRLRLSDLEVMLPALKNHPSLLHLDISENILSDVIHLKQMNLPFY